MLGSVGFRIHGVPLFGVPIGLRDTGSHVHDDFLSLLVANRVGTHEGIVIVLVIKHEYRGTRHPPWASSFTRSAHAS